MSESVRIGCVQLAARDVQDAGRALDEAVEAAEAAAREADLVVLPEATYPGYVLHDATRWLDVSLYDEALGAFSEVARGGKAFVAVGLARPADGKLLNSALLLDPAGDIYGVADKTFLWHFDAKWFEPGAPGQVHDLPWGRAGMFVCADARLPELPRRLAIAGADLLIDCTALVLGAGGVNGQIEYMLSTRAWENAAYLAVANKCGAEAGLAHYAGRSSIYSPSGERLSEAPADKPAIIYATVDLSARPPLPAARAAGGYPALVAPTNSLGVTTYLRSPSAGSSLRLAMCTGLGGESGLALDELGADLAVGAEASAPHEIIVTDGLDLLYQGRKLRSGDVLDVAGIPVGVLTGDRGMVPEEARTLMLAGVALIVWGGIREMPQTELLRTRADENRVFMAVVTVDGAWTVWSPLGTLAASGPDPALDAVLVEMPLALALHKEMAPGSDVVTGRTPHHYGELAG